MQNDYIYGRRRAEEVIKGGKFSKTQLTKATIIVYERELEFFALESSGNAAAYCRGWRHAFEKALGKDMEHDYGE